MAKKAAAKIVASSLRLEKSGHRPDTTRQKPSFLLDTRVVYCGDNLEQLVKLLTGDCIITPGARKPDESTAQSYADAAHFCSAKEEPPHYRTN